MTQPHRSVRALIAGAATAVALGVAPAVVAADSNTQIGTLDCDVSGGVGLILGSKKDMTCVFHKKDGTEEKYTGRVTKIGLDIGETKAAHLKWEVLAPTTNEKAGALAGKYDGVTAEATVVGGVGANVLFSAGNNLTLQPLSVQDQEGYNIAAGLAQIKLDYAGE